MHKVTYFLVKFFFNLVLKTVCIIGNTNTCLKEQNAFLNKVLLK